MIQITDELTLQERATYPRAKGQMVDINVSSIK